MKTFEELLAENNELATRVAALSADLKASHDLQLEMATRLEGLEESNAATAALLAASDEKRLRENETLKGAIEGVTGRIAALETAKEELHLRVAAELAKRGISLTAASDRAGKATGNDVLAQYEAEKDPIAAGRIFKEHRETILAKMRGR